MGDMLSTNSPLRPPTVLKYQRHYAHYFQRDLSQTHSLANFASSNIQCIPPLRFPLPFLVPTSIPIQTFSPRPQWIAPWHRVNKITPENENCWQNYDWPIMQSISNESESNVTLFKFKLFNPIQIHISSL